MSEDQINRATERIVEAVDVVQLYGNASLYAAIRPIVEDLLREHESALISLRCERDVYRKRYGAFTGTEISDIEKAGLSLELVEILEDRCSNLERERDTALAERDRLREELKATRGHTTWKDAKRLMDAEAERDELREAAEELLKALDEPAYDDWSKIVSARERLCLALRDKEQG